MAEEYQKGELKDRIITGAALSIFTIIMLYSFGILGGIVAVVISIIIWGKTNQKYTPQDSKVQK